MRSGARRAHALARQLNRVLILVLMRARSFDRDFGINLGLEATFGLNHAVDAARRVARVLAADPELARDPARDLGLALAHAVECARAFDLAHVRAHALAISPELARDVDRAVERIRSLALDLDRAHHLALAIDCQVAKGEFQDDTASVVVPTASSMLAAAVRLLPAAYQTQYAEEYQSELWDLATANCSRWQQLGYAFRALRSALFLGFELRTFDTYERGAMKSMLRQIGRAAAKKFPSALVRNGMPVSGPTEQILIPISDDIIDH